MQRTPRWMDGANLRIRAKNPRIADRVAVNDRMAKVARTRRNDEFSPVGR